MRWNYVFLVLGFIWSQSVERVVAGRLGAEKGSLNGRNTNNNCHNACAFLATLLPGKVSLPQSSIYELEEFQYWSVQQSTTRPACRITPSCAEDISSTLNVLKAQQCQFAVKSGGHGSFVGASNINGGVAIDLRGLNSLTVSLDRTQVSVGAGLVWSEVYSQLDAVNLGVIGGRVAGIGVGGLTLGGGISFFSGRFGWACDNVNNYQVVFADGSINDVNLHTYPELYFALRGGGNNFGIVTRFDLASFEQGKMWGGQTTLSADKMPGLIQAFHDFNINHYQDPQAAVILAYVYFVPYGTFLASIDLEYSLPMANPPILSNFTSIPNLVTSARITNLTDLTVELNATQPGGLRETFWAFMVRNDVQLMADIQKIYEEEVANIITAADVVPALVYQPISTAMTSHFTKNGGNALGITEADGPLTLINTSVAWSNISDDARILTYAANLINRSVTLAKSRDLDFRYIYQNYAAIQQDVFRGYGHENHEKLIAIHEKYDPDGVFTKLQPGYFKL